MMQPSAMALSGIARTYPGPPPLEALKQIDLRVNTGELIAIMGASGSGKTTLLNIMGLLDRPTAGRYQLGGRDVSKLSERDRTRARAELIGFVFQDFYLLDERTAAENVMVGLLYKGVARSQRRSRAISALTSVSLEARVDATPSELSGGERQRVAIARALTGSPSVILCDEPTGNLDTANTDSVLDLLQALHAKGMTIAVVTHDPRVARRAERVVLMRDGAIVQDGAP